MIQKTKFFGLMLAALLVGLAWAAGTPAGTNITNVASATYNDSSGNPQTTFSNPVTTVVTEVYGLTITPNGTEIAPGQSESALPGAPVYFNYVVTNTGNTADIINLSAVQSALDDFDLSGVTIYHDVACNGTIAGDPIITSISLPADGSACIIVAGVIPGTAADGAEGLINLVGSSAGDPTKTDDDNWAVAVANTGPNLTANKAATPSGAVAAGGTIAYSITGSNNGGAAAHGVDIATALGALPTGYAGAATGIVITDSIPAGTEFNAGSLTGSAGAGSVTLIYNDGAGWTTTAPAAADVTAVGMIVSGTGAFFPQTANYAMGFAVTVASSATAGSTINNTAIVSYSTDGTDTVEEDTNTTANTVTAGYGVAIGPSGNAITDGLAGTASYTDPVSGDTWNVSLSGDYSAETDTQTITDIVNTGDTVAFRHTIRNLGNASDSFTISTSNTAGYTVQLFRADGVTPLVGSVGPLAVGAEADIVVKVLIPATATLGTTVTVTATSLADATQTDISTDVIPAPESGYGVDLATSGNAGDGDPTNDDPAPVSTAPGTTVSFPIDVANTGSQTDNYNFTADLPAAWTVTFVQDTDCDGTADGAAVTNTGSIAGGATSCFVAVVSIPAGESPDDYEVDFTVTSATDPTVTDTITADVTVTTVAGLTFVTDQIGTVSPDSTITYTHTLTNNGNDTATVEIPAQTGTAFTYQYSINGTDWFSSLDGVNSFTLAAGASTPVYVRVITPGSAVDGQSETVTVTATATYPSTATASASVTDTTIVQAGELTLAKSARTCEDAACTTVLSATGATAEPGNYLEYSIVASNIGSGILTNVKISDPLPPFTDFVSVSAVASVAGTILYSTDGTTWSDTAPVALAAGGTIYVGLDTNADTDISTADTLAAAGSITVTFIVQVQ